MAHAAMAARRPGFEFFFAQKLDSKFRQILIDEKFEKALQWASTFEATARTPALPWSSRTWFGLSGLSGLPTRKPASGFRKQRHSTSWLAT